MNAVIPPAIRPRDRDAVIQALRAGVVPRVGAHLVQVGRVKEVGALLKDIEKIADGGTAFRVVVGAYGAGKTFFLNLVRAIALERKLVTISADLNPDRRLQSSSGQARSLYAELTKNMATRNKPDGNALTSVVEAFIAQARTEATQSSTSVDAVIAEKLRSLAELVNGPDFALVVSKYWRGHNEGNDALKADAVRWLRGEFATKTDARRALGVASIVDDDSVYDQLKLLSRFVRLAGYKGLLVNLDEMVNLYKLANTQSRNANYEQILRILNDSLQGTCEGLGFVLGGTPEFLSDQRRGLYSYAALQSRLAENSFAAAAGVHDYTGPVLRLAALTHEDFFVLLQKLRHVFACGKEQDYLVPDDTLKAFMGHAAQRLGEEYFRTPRTTITSFLNLLAVLDQSRETRWQDLVGTVPIDVDVDSGSTVTEIADDPAPAPAVGAAGNSTQATPAAGGLKTFRL